ncbi:MAG: AMP-binding protein [Rhodospirillales bacterium]|nr:AMP-binding protein [Rhodospirillales bacterium]
MTDHSPVLPIPWPNLVTMFLDQADRYGDRPLLWAKRQGEYVGLTWADVADQVCRLASGLKALGIRPGDRVVLVSENRPEWAISDLAIMAAGAVTVPAYTTNTAADHLHILSNCGARGVIASSAKLTRTVVAAADRGTDLAVAVSLDPPPRDHQHTPRIVPWNEALELGSRNTAPIRDEAATISADQLACLIYTSGTGGAPKGVMLHHGAILHNCEGAARLLAEFGGEPTAHVFLSFLPLSHAYEHTVGQFLPLRLGAQIYYAEGVDKLLTNVAEVRPTIMSAVPRFYELLQQRISQAAHKSGGLRGAHVFRRHCVGPKTLSLTPRSGTAATTGRYSAGPSRASANSGPVRWAADRHGLRWCTAQCRRRDLSARRRTAGIPGLRANRGRPPYQRQPPPADQASYGWTADRRC